MRYLWELYPAYLHEFTGSRWRRAVMAPLCNYLRLWDYSAAARVDEFIGSSENARRRIWRTYRRESRVIFPPIAVETYYSKPSGDYLLAVSELVAYKQLDYVVRLCTRNGLRLKIVGDGPELRTLKSLAGATIEICGRVSDLELRELYACCRAFVSPGEEDFGMATVEALASGKPVIGLNRGGTREIVGPDCGILYDEPSEVCLEQALDKLYGTDFRVEKLQSAASKFSEAKFSERMQAVLQTPQESLQE